MLRIVQPEILDSLPADAPDAVRSRQDLRRINYLMDNFRWLERALEDAELPRGSHIVEVGSGGTPPIK
ncbi:MAG: hypothetical protein P1U86_12025 [Verrucomicrobiales bacterium]|nr:hypothetical protein [Verrucomicrobiales bacterium]